MTKQQTAAIIEQALNVAASKGCFTLKDSTSIYGALEEMKFIFQDHDKLYSDPVQPSPAMEVVQSNRELSETESISIAPKVKAKK